MSKQEFLARLRDGLAGLPQDDVEERLNFYSEMIDDRMEEGLPEEEAVAAIGAVETIVPQIVAEIPLPKLVRESVRPKRQLAGWEIALLVIGSPVWFSLIIAALAIMFSVYVVIWSVIFSLWAVDLAFCASSVACVIAGLVMIVRGGGSAGLLLIGAGFILGGMSVFLFFGCLAATKGAAVLTKEIAAWMKSMFIRKDSGR